MSRIQKALQKIQEQRKEGAGLRLGGLSPLERISYTDTKVVTADRGMLLKNKLIAASFNEPRAQIFKNLRSQVARSMRQNGWTTLGVTSPNNNEGKSMVACNLALAMSMELNQSVLLIDLDLKDPSVGEYFGMPVEDDLLGYINGKNPINKALINPGYDRLVLLPAKPLAENSAEVLSSPKMASLMKELKSRYKSRIIICDLPPALPTDDVLAALSFIDCSLLVLEDGRNSAADIQKCMSQLQQTQILGAVLNKTPE